MKGVVFTEFMEMVESRWGFEQLDRIIDEAALPHGGAYVATGTYPHGELVGMVMALASATGMDASDLIRAFGEHLFARFTILYPESLEGAVNAMSFLERVHDVIHVEVRKLYPDAELPSIICERSPDGAMDVHYRSTRSFGDLAEGLIIGCTRHFGDDLAIERDDRSCAAGSHVVFRLVDRQAA